MELVAVTDCFVPGSRPAACTASSRRSESTLNNTGSNHWQRADRVSGYADDGRQESARVRASLAHAGDNGCA